MLLVAKLYVATLAKSVGINAAHALGERGYGRCGYFWSRLRIQIRPIQMEPGEILAQPIGVVGLRFREA